MPYGPPLYGIFWEHIFCKYGGWGWSEFFSFVAPEWFVSQNSSVVDGNVGRQEGVTIVSFVQQAWAQVMCI